MRRLRSRLLSPVWLVGHLLVAVVLVTFPLLGLWQLDRYDQQQARNARLAARGQQPPLTAAELDGDPQALAFRRVAVTGTWQPEREVLVSPRPLRSRPGHHVLTPLRLADDSVVLVDRGWVPYDADAPPVADAAPPKGRVRVTGVVIAGRDARRAGTLGGQGQARKPADITDADAVEFMSQADPALLGRLRGQALPGVVIRAGGGHRRADASLPVTAPALEPDQDVNHFSYAMQWFLFTGVVAASYPILLRRRARDARVDDVACHGDSDRAAARTAPHQPAP